MKKIIFFIVTSVITYSCIAQNVGVGTATPTEKLDVNGNLNVNGQLKISGNAGTAGQVLMIDASNNTAWGDLSVYKNMIVYDCNSTSTNCTPPSWTVPAGVTSILVECWGGGGGGCSVTGGGGGGYISAKINVAPLSIATLSIGAGGVYGSTTANGSSGGQTSFYISPYTLYADGGGGGVFGDPFVWNFITTFPPQGGGYSAIGLSSQYIGFYGSPGGITKLNFSQVSISDFAKVADYGEGGDAPLLPGSGSRGGYRFVSSLLINNYFASSSGIQQGGGGGADIGQALNHVGSTGRGGRIIIHW